MLLSLRHMCSGFGVDELSERQRSQFLLKWAKRSSFTWKEIIQHPKHGLGYEMMPARQIHPTPPEHLQQDKYMVFRHDGNQPVVGFKVGDVFHALWFEADYGDVYDHG
ncbi:MAG: hypothetical protein J7518_11390 [Nocardioidaceae bacterium]|nr:hypothetical protein [Nocardioidaceae bacterium]